MEFFPVSINGLIIALLVSPFIFVATALSILRFGLGITGSGMGLVVILVAFAISIGADSAKYEEIAQGKQEAVKVGVSKIKEKLGKDEEPRILIKEYAIFQFKEGCRIGLMWLIPFVVIDLLAIHISGLLGVKGLTESSVPLALKLFLVLSVTGIDKIVDVLSAWMK